MGWRE